MANNYSTEKDKASSEKFFICRLTPARDISDDIILESDSLYSTPLDVPHISKVEVDGSEYSEADLPLTGFEWNYDGDTLYINGIGEDSTVIIFYDIYISTKAGIYSNHDPINETGQIVRWVPRLIGGGLAPKISQKNTIYGSLEISTISAEISNADDNFNKYFTNNDSWNSKEALVWHCIGTIDNIKLLYKGFINDVSFGDNISILIDDVFTKLDDIFELPFVPSSPGYDPKDHGKKYPIIFQSVSKYTEISRPSISATDITYDGAVSYNSAASVTPKIIPGSMHKAYVTNYNTDGSTFTGWEADILREGETGVYAITDTVISFTNPDTDRFYIQVADESLYHIGDNIVVFSEIDGDPTETVFMVYAINPGEIRVYFMDVITSSGNIADGDTIKIPRLSLVQLVDTTSQDSFNGGFSVPLVYNRDYNLDTVTIKYDSRGPLLGNSFYIQIIQVDLSSSDFNFYTGTPNNDNVSLYYRRRSGDGLNHSKFMKEVINYWGGIDIDTTSFSSAETVDIEVNKVYPDEPTSQDSNYRDIVEPVLSNVPGLLYPNDDFDISYSVLNAPSSTREVDETDIIKDSFKNRLRYLDLSSRLVAERKHGYTSTTTPGETSSPIEYTTDRGRLLHGGGKTKNFILELDTDDFESSSLSKIKTIYGERFYTVELELSSKFSDLKINDDLNISYSGLLGNDTSRQFKVIELTKGPNTITATLTDILSS